MNSLDTEKASDIAFSALERAHDDVLKLPPALQTVVIIYSVQAMIDNGGFQFLFESDFPGKPSYEVMIEAYRRIGATACATAFSRAVTLFPFADPHLHRRKREKLLDAWREGPKSRNPLEPLTHAVCGNKKVWKLLDSYVRKNMVAFGAASGTRDD